MTSPNRRGPKPLSDVLGELFATRGYGRLRALKELEDAWNAAVGEPGCRFTRLGEVRRGILNVTVAHPALLEELAAFQKPAPRRDAPVGRHSRPLGLRTGAPRNPGSAFQKNPGHTSRLPTFFPGLKQGLPPPGGSPMEPGPPVRYTGGPLGCFLPQGRQRDDP
jgi:Dna[CI] antecedent, DciA